MSQEQEIRGAQPPGKVIGGRFTVEGVLGRGGFAITYLCRSGEYNKAFAVKEFLPNSLAVRESDGNVYPISAADQELYDRGIRDFVEEGRRLNQCRHPNIVQVEDHFREFGTAYLVMEYIEGVTLEDYIKTHGKINGKDLLRFLYPALDALITIHEADLLHRDLTPRNILLRKSLDNPVIIDFGAARNTSAIRTKTIANVYSDGYSPPEQYNIGETQTPALDIYSFGCIALHCLLGEHPPSSINRQDDRLLKNNDALPLGEKEKLLCPVISKATSLDKNDRHQSMTELKTDILAVEVVWNQLEQLEYELTNSNIPDSSFNWYVDGEDHLVIVGNQDSMSEIDHAKAQIHKTMPDLNIKVETSNKNNQHRRYKPAGPRKKGANAGALLLAVASLLGIIAIVVLIYAVPDTSPGNKTSPAVEITKVDPNINKDDVNKNEGATEKPVSSNQTSHTSNPETKPEVPFAIKIQLPTTKFKVGDNFSFAVQANKKCDFIIYTVDSENKTTAYDPRAVVDGVDNKIWMGTPTLDANVRRQLPIPNAPGKLTIQPPLGTYQMFAVCGRQNLGKLDEIRQKLATAAARKTRQFRFDLNASLGNDNNDILARAFATYTVE